MKDKRYSNNPTHTEQRAVKLVFLAEPVQIHRLLSLLKTNPYLIQYIALCM